MFGPVEKDKKINIFIAIFTLNIVIWGSYAFRFGIVMSPDSYSYAKWADLLIANNFNIVNYHKAMESLPTSFLYIGFIGLVALTKIIAGLSWKYLIIAINLILGACLSVILADLVYIFTKNKLSAWITFLLYAFNFEIMLWSRYVLSDISYMFLNFLVFYFVAKAFLAKEGQSAKFWIITLLVFIASIFYRPTAIVMLPVILLAFYLYNRKKNMQWKLFFASFVFFATVSMFIHAAVIKNIWSLQQGKSAVRDFVVLLYQKGIVIHDRPYTYHYPPSALLDYVSITADKFVHFFYFSNRQFSFIHNLFNYLVFVPLYAFIILGIVSVAQESDNSIKRSLVALSVIMIIAYGLFHSMTLIDFDWRYRLPVLPYMLFIAGLGVKYLAQRGRKTKDA